MHEEVSQLRRHIADVKHLLNDQARRIATKAEGHSDGSTARALYEQQMSFIDRLLRRLED
jgi:hypothetical protein